jgi:hypothetical protein
MSDLSATPVVVRLGSEGQNLAKFGHQMVGPSAVRTVVKAWLRLWRAASSSRSPQSRPARRLRASGCPLLIARTASRACGLGPSRPGVDPLDRASSKPPKSRIWRMGPTPNQFGSENHLQSHFDRSFDACLDARLSAWRLSNRGQAAAGRRASSSELPFANLFTPDVAAPQRADHRTPP